MKNKKETNDSSKGPKPLQSEELKLSLGEFIEAATSQLQTPLWSILGFTSKLEKKYNKQLDNDGKHWLTRISANVNDMHQYIENLINYILIDSRAPILRPIFIEETIQEVARRIQQEIDARFSLESQLDMTLKMTGDPGNIRELFFQIFKNSALYCPKDRNPHCRLTAREQKGSLIIDISDNGIGIPEEYRELVLLPTEQLKEISAPGMGIGFSLIQKILSKHKASFKLNDNSEGGLLVSLVFPHAII